MAEWNPGIHEEPASNPKMWAYYRGVGSRRREVYMHDIPRHLTEAEVKATLGLPDDLIRRFILYVDEDGRSTGQATTQLRRAEDNWNVPARINGTDCPYVTIAEFSWDTSENEILKKFQEYTDGEITGIILSKNECSDRTYGIVFFQNEGDAENASVNLCDVPDLGFKVTSVGTKSLVSLPCLIHKAAEERRKSIKQPAKRSTSTTTTTTTTGRTTTTTASNVATGRTTTTASNVTTRQTTTPTSNVAARRTTTTASNVATERTTTAASNISAGRTKTTTSNAATARTTTTSHTADGRTTTTTASNMTGRTTTTASNMATSQTPAATANMGAELITSLVKQLAIQPPHPQPANAQPPLLPATHLHLPYSDPPPTYPFSDPNSPPRQPSQPSTMQSESYYPQSALDAAAAEMREEFAKTIFAPLMTRGGTTTMTLTPAVLANTDPFRLSRVEITDPRCVEVWGLPKHYGGDGLKHLLSPEYGVDRADIFYNADGTSQGRGCIWFYNHIQAKIAEELLSSRTFQPYHEAEED